MWQYGETETALKTWKVLLLFNKALMKSLRRSHFELCKRFAVGSGFQCFDRITARNFMHVSILIISCFLFSMSCQYDEFLQI